MVSPFSVSEKHMESYYSTRNFYHMVPILVTSVQKKDNANAIKNGHDPVYEFTLSNTICCYPFKPYIFLLIGALLYGKRFRRIGVEINKWELEINETFICTHIFSTLARYKKTPRRYLTNGFLNFSKLCPNLTKKKVQDAGLWKFFEG